MELFECKLQLNILSIDFKSFISALLIKYDKVN